ncbi:WXG100 family type VII secretion target [Streptomyces mirabilis]
MATYTYVDGEMAQVAEEMMAIANQIKATHDDLTSNSVYALSEWSTDARDAYNAVKVPWDNAVNDMVQKAADAAAHLTDIHAEYTGATRQASSFWGR